MFLNIYFVLLGIRSDFRKKLHLFEFPTLETPNYIGRVHITKRHLSSILFSYWNSTTELEIWDFLFKFQTGYLIQKRNISLHRETKSQIMHIPADF